MIPHSFRLGGVVVAFFLLASAPLPLSSCLQDKKDSGDALPEGALARMGTTRLRHTNGVSRVVYSPNGKLLASFGRDRTLRVWEAASGRQLHAFFEADNEYCAVAWSPDGSILAAAANSQTGRNFSICFFDLQTGKETSRLNGHSQPAYCLAFSSDGKTLVSASLDKVIRWDLANRAKQSEWRINATAALAVAPDGKTLAWVDGETEDKSVHICDCATGQEIRLLKGHQHSVVSVAWSPDGKFVASGNSFDPIFLWEVGTGNVARRLDQQGGGMCLQFSADGRWVAGAGMDGSVHLWEAATGNEQPKLTGYRGWVNAIAFAPDGKTLALAGAESQVIHQWDVDLAKERRTMAGHFGQVHAVAYSPDGKLLATGSGDWHAGDNAICVWDAATGKEARRLACQPGRIWALTFSPDGKWIASGSEKESSFRVWDSATGEQLAKFQRKLPDDPDGEESRVWAVAWSPDGKLLASSHDQGLLILWDFETGAQLRAFRGHEGIIQSLAFSPDGKLLVSGSVDRTVRVWNVATAGVVRQISDLSDGVKCVGFSPDGRLIAGAVGDFDGVYHLWEAASGRQIARLPAARARIYQFAFSPDGKLLAGTGPDNSLCLWEIATRGERCRFSGHPAGNLAIAFAPDGRSVASGSQDTTALVWNAAHCLDLARPQTTQDFDQLWADLGTDDVNLAHRTICTLLAEPAKAVEMLEQHLRRFTSADADQMAKALADLNHDRFQVREKASNDLARLGELAEPFLRKTLQRPPSLEVRHRVELLLDRLETSRLAPDQLRALRAYEVLERIGGSQARQLFETHASQLSAGRLGREAQASLDRLTRK